MRLRRLLPRDRGWSAGLALGVLVGCSSTLDPATGDLRRDLQHADPRVRIDAAQLAVRESRIDLCGLLVQNLGDRDGAVRLFSSVALRKLTGQDFDYKAYGTLVERQESIERWVAWLKAQGLLARDVELPERRRDVPAPGSSTRPEAEAGEASPEAAGGADPGASPTGALDSSPLDSATGNPVENAPPRAKISGEKADDRWVGTTSKPARS